MQPKIFTFESYSFDSEQLVASFRYSFDNDLHFCERIYFADFRPDYDQEVFDRVLRLAFFIVGTSYVKTFPTVEIDLSYEIDEWQAQFLNSVYQEGLSQFAFENKLTRDQLPHFKATTDTGSSQRGLSYGGKGIVALQSGGKDSLLLGSLLLKKEHSFTSLYVSSSDTYPSVIDTLGRPVLLLQRKLDTTGLQAAYALGGLNGHVPVTYIMAAYSLLQVVLQGKDTVLAAIGHEGEEPHDTIGDLPVMHQWSKTWAAEKLLSEYIRTYISPDLKFGSPLRHYSELRITELFSIHAWQTFGHVFSSCNIANYKQGQVNQRLLWCGDCPKCANNFLLFAPFIEPDKLMNLFDHQNLFEKESLQVTFMGLLGIDTIMKPFECVGEVEELRTAYHMAREKWGEAVYTLPFSVPLATYDYRREYDAQPWAHALIDKLA